MDTDFKINIVSTADNAGFKSAAAAAVDLKEETVGAMEKTATATEGAASAGEKFVFHGEGMRRVIGQLNKIAPGMGEAFHGIEAAVTRGGGALIVVSLAIEAAMTYWDMYKERAAAAAEAAAKALDHVREVGHEALVDFEEYEKAINKLFTPHDKYAAALEREEAVFNAQIKSRQELLKLSEANDLSLAKTPEETAAVKRKYAGLESDLDASAESGKAALLQKTIAKIQAEFDKNLQEIHVLNDMKSANAGNTPLLEQLNQRSGVLYKENEGLAGQLGNYRNQLGTAQAVQQEGDYSRALVKKLNERDSATGHSLQEMGNAAHLNQSQIIEIARQFITKQMSHDREISGLKALMRNLCPNTK